MQGGDDAGEKQRNRDEGSLVINWQWVLLMRVQHRILLCTRQWLKGLGWCWSARGAAGALPALTAA